MTQKLIMPETPFDLCERRTITIQNLDGPAEAPSWVEGNLAAHSAQYSGADLFAISAVSNGLSLASCGALFRTLEGAVRAMLELNAAGLDFSTSQPIETLEAAIVICLKHDCFFKDREQVLRFTILQKIQGRMGTL